jgi:hypothetical protein
VLLCPQVDIDGVEDDEEGEAPANAVNDDLFTARRELVDHGPE